jgi:hypothetical protein
MKVAGSSGLDGSEADGVRADPVPSGVAQLWLDAGHFVHPDLPTP